MEAAGQFEPGRPFLTYRTDENQADITKILKKLGFRVRSTHKVGGGFHDLVIEKHGLNILAEVKDGSKTYGGRQLSPEQRKFHFGWRGLKCVLTNEADCINLNSQVDILSMKIANAGIKMEVCGCTDPFYFPVIFDAV